MIYRFGELELDAKLPELRRGGSTIPLEPLALRVLLYLIEHRDEVVSKDRLIAGVWPEAYVSDSSLARSIHQVRRAVDDDAQRQEVIKTFYGRGYRFVATLAGGGSEEAGQTPPAQTSSPPHTLRPAVRRLGLALALPLLVIAAAALLRSRSHREDRAAAAAQSPVVAVLGFHNLSADPATDWIGVALAEWFTTELTLSPEVETVTQQDVARMAVDIDVSALDRLPGRSLARIGTYLGSEYVVRGAYTIHDGYLRLDLHLDRAPTGERVASWAESGPERNLFAVVEAAGAHLRSALGGAAGEVEPVALRATQPRDPRAVRLYAEGLDHLRRHDALEARDLLMQAVSIEPAFPLSHAALSRAWAALGYLETARREAQTALELAAGLPEEVRLLLQARYHQAAEEWPLAVEGYATLWRRSPGRLEYGLELAAAQAAAGEGEAALETVAQLRRLPAPAPSDPRIDLAEVEATGAVSDFKRQRQAARRAAEGAASRGSRVLLARAKMEEAWALRHLGNAPEAQALIEAAAEVFRETGDRGGLATALRYQAILLYDLGELKGSLENCEAAFEIARQIGNRLEMAKAKGNCGVFLWQQGQLAEAVAQIEASLDIFSEVGDDKQRAGALNNLGWIHFAAGDLDRAERRFGEALLGHQEVDDRDGVARSLGNLAVVLTAAGRLDLLARQAEASGYGLLARRARNPHRLKQAQPPRSPDR